MTTAKHSNSEAPKRSSRDKVRAHRERMRAKGLRPVTLWSIDTRTTEFTEQMRHGVEAIRRAEAHSTEEQAVNAILAQAVEDILASTPPYDWGDKDGGNENGGDENGHGATP